MKKVILCGHTGSHNRGCEAIVKSTADLFTSLGVDVILATHDFPYDCELGILEFSQVVEYAEFRNHPVRRGVSLVMDRIFRAQYAANCLRQKDVWKVAAGNIVLNVGGDTYCYDVMPKTSVNLNLHCDKHNIPCIFWGCSIEKEKMQNRTIHADLGRYSSITPREPITYQHLLEANFPKENLYLMADPAFTLTPISCELPGNFIPNNTVGINLSPLVMEWSSNGELVWDNYCNTIDYIIRETSMNICFIPHVYRTETDYDMIPLLKLYEKYKSTGRVSIIRNTWLGCKQFKYIISQCRFLITARTHASIAAYSSLVPTLVLGYSVKSIGIAIDLFGKSENYVLATNNLQENIQLLKAFKYIVHHEREITEVLSKRIPLLQQRIREICRIVIKKYG